MTWQGIAAGANGVVMYSFASMRKSMKEDEFRRHWPDVLAVANEMKACAPIVLMDPLETEGMVTKDVVVRAWRQDGRTWYLAVNRSRGPASCAVRLSEKAAGVKPVAGSGARLSADGLSLNCAFGPLGYALVEVRDVR